MGDDSPSPGRAPQVTDDDIKTLLAESDSPVLTTGEIADQIAIGERGTLDRLQQLADADEIGSKTAGQTKIWWSPAVGMRAAWPTSGIATGEGDDKIGVPVVDGLDVPGRGETVAQRRRAVNAVFAALFTEDTVGVEKLRWHGWTAAPPVSYDSAISLWTNCLQPALADVVFFEYVTDDNAWTLIPLAQGMRDEFGERVLWANWSERSRWLRAGIAIDFRDKTEQLLDRHSIFNNIENINDDPSRLRVSGPRLDLLLQIHSDDTFWYDPTTTIEILLDVVGSETIEHVKDNKEDIRSELSLDTMWSDRDDLSDESKGLRISSSIPVTFQVDQINTTPSNRSLPPPIDEYEWLTDTMTELHNVFSQYI